MPHNQRLRIGFFTDGPSFDGETLKDRALGGSETALIQAARALAVRGHEVLVFNNCKRPGLYDKVAYLPPSDFRKTALTGGFDVFIVSRFAGFFQIPFQARIKVLWNHDTLNNPALLNSVLDKVDLLMVLSRYHRDNYITRLPILENRLTVTRNGVDLELIHRSIAGAVKDPNKIIYASRPERGLKHLLEDIWPRLIEAYPDLTLYLCGYPVDRGLLPQDLLQLYAYLDDLIAGQPNVVNLGFLSKKDFYRNLAESALMLYPCNFPEISCINAIEAQACRTPIITTDDFALSETVVVPDYKIAGRPGRPGYTEAFIRISLTLLEDPARAAALAAAARSIIEKRYAWPVIVADWERFFKIRLTRRRKKTRVDFLEQHFPGPAETIDFIKTRDRYLA